jgi:uncharacterized membrane protein YhaH (DUF805 family)
MDTWNFLFGFRGRIARRDFYLLISVAVAIAICMFIVGRLTTPPATTFIDALLWFALVAVWLSAATRRLHDRDKSAWYLLLFFGVPSLLQTWLSPAAKGNLKLMFFSGGTGSFLEIVSLAIGIWMIVELGCLRGSVGPNKYGPDPLAESEPQSA